MLQSNAPAKLVLPFANSGAKNVIPVASQIGITPGAASLTDGFPPLTRTPLVAGGVPPSGLDMNGVLFALAAIDRWSNAGGRYYYDAAFATDTEVNGYPKGAVVLRTDGEGGWLNTVDDNESDPEAGGAGWVPDFQYGSTTVTMTNANVTLTPLQAGRPLIIISGLLTANLNLVFPNYIKTWSVVNNTTGAFSVTCKTAAGTGVTVAQASAAEIYGDGVNIGTIAQAAATIPDASTTVKGIVELATNAETITGTDTTRAITAAGLQAKVASDTALGIVELATNAETITGTDTTRAITPANLRAASLALGQTWQNVSGSRALNTTYTNSTGKSIAVVISVQPSASGNTTLVLDGVTYGQAISASTATIVGSITLIVPNGGTYRLNSSGTVSITNWLELR